MDDVESEREAMQILNDGSADVINLTTLKMSYPECPNVFQPVRRVKKEKQNTTQTEDWLEDGGKYGSPSVSSNSVVQQEKNGSGAWYKKFDMRGRRQSKEDKKKHRNSIEHEQVIVFNIFCFVLMKNISNIR